MKPEHFVSGCYSDGEQQHQPNRSCVHLASVFGLHPTIVTIVSIFDQCGSKHRVNNPDGCSSQLLISPQTCDVGNLNASHTYPPTHHRIYSMKNRSENYKILDATVPRLVVPRCPKGHQHVSSLSMGQKFPGELGQRSWFVSYIYYLHMRFLVNITVPSVEALRMFVAKAKPSQWIN